MTYDDFELGRILRYYLDIPNINQACITEKHMGLRGLGYSEEEADRLCTPIELSEEEKMKLLEERVDEANRELEKFNRERRKLAKLNGSKASPNPLLNAGK